MVPVHAQAAPHARREHRLQAAALPAAEPVRLQAQGVLEGVQLAQVRAVVRVQRHGERAAPAIAQFQTGRLGQLRDEGRIPARRGEIEVQEGLLPVLQLRDGGQHPRRHVCGPAARLRVRHGCAQALLGRPPRRDQADEAAAHYDDVIAMHLLLLPSAGMTRIRFVRSAAGQPPSQPGPPGSRECVFAWPP